MPAPSSWRRCSSSRRSASRPAVDPRVQGLDPAVEHLRAAGHGRDIGHGQARLAQRPRRPAGRDQLEAAGDEPAAEIHESGLVRNRQQRAARHRNDARPRARDRSSTRRPSTAIASASSNATARGSSRCSTARIRAWSVSASSPGRIGTASWATIGPPSSVASTRWTVHPVTATPCARASRTAWAPGNAGSSDGCVLRIRSGERRQGPTVPGSACSRRARRRRAGPPRASSARVSSSLSATRAVSIPCSVAQSSAGHARSAKTKTISPPSSPRAAAAWRARRFEPAPDTPTAIRPAPVTQIPRAGPRHSGRRRRPRPRSPPRRCGRRRSRRGRTTRSPSSRPRAAARPTIPMPPLNVARSSSSSIPPSAPNRRITEGMRQRPGSRRARQAIGHGARHVAGQPAARDVGDARDVHAGRADRRPRREHGSRVHARRRQQDLAQRRHRLVGGGRDRRLGLGVAERAPEARLVRLREVEVPLRDEGHTKQSNNPVPKPNPFLQHPNPTTVSNPSTTPHPHQYPNNPNKHTKPYTHTLHPNPHNHLATTHHHNSNPTTPTTHNPPRPSSQP